MYLPWLGLFDRIQRCDAFVLLDNVPYSKNYFINRNKIKTSTGWMWLTVPVLVSGRFNQLIKDIRIDNTTPWSEKHWKSIFYAYKKAPYLSRYADFFERTYNKKWMYLTDIIYELFFFILNELKIKTPIIKASELGVMGKKEELVLNICKKLNADVYLSGPSGRDYLNLRSWQEKNIKVSFHDYTHPTYPQLYGEFLPEMSIIDLLFNCGDASLTILSHKRNNPKVAEKIFDKITSSGVFLIAEVGCNFEKDFERAKEMIKVAASTGADAIKFQTFVTEKLVTKDAPKFWDIKGCPGGTQYEEFSQMPHLTFEQYRELKKVADDAGIIFFSTPSDEESADLLEKIGVSIYKVSSMDITHLPLLRHIAKKNKPIIISTGASTIEEIKEAIEVIESEGNKQIIILHCITNYPTKIEDVHLNMMKHIMAAFPQYPVGYSDHTKMPESIHILTAAVAMGAKVIEKHFTFDKTRPGYDHEISADYEDLRRIVNIIRVIEEAKGMKVKKPILYESKARRWARRSLVAKVDIAKDVMITKEMLVIKRPGTGIEPKFLEKVVGKRSLEDIKKDTVITWNMVC